MVKVPQRILKRWRELSADSAKVRIEMLFSSRLDPTDAANLLAESVNRVVRDFEAAQGDLPPGVDEPFVGEWDVAAVPEGVLLIGGYKSDAFEQLLQGIADDLTRNGVRGKLDLYELPDIPALPGTIGVVEGHVRTLGRRVVDRRDRWAAERSALDRVLAAATGWCLRARPDRGIILQAGAMPALLVRREDSALDRLRAMVGDAGKVTLRSVGDDRFRSVTVAPGEGRVTVVEGGPVLHRTGWRPTVAAVTDLLASVSADAVYGFVRRAGDLLYVEWATPPRTDRLRGSSWEAVAREDHLAPDAFAIQLLGPAYEGRLPDGADWRVTALGRGRVLVEHVEPAPWFDELSLAEALSGEAIPRRGVLERARASLGPMLYEDATEEEKEREHEWNVAHSYVGLPETIVAKVHALPETPYVGHWDVALVLRDGSVLEDVELGFNGEVVTRIAGRREFSLETDDIVDVLDRSRN